MKKPTYETAVRTHIGLVRERNEDSVDLAQMPLGQAGPGVVLTVADGMGGVSGGATASALTVQVVSEAIGRLSACLDPLDANWQRRVTQWLRDTALKANSMVRQLAQDQPSLKGMGTTLLLGVVIDGWIGLAWVGDSRAYLLRDATLVQLTRDHTWDVDREMEGRADDPDVLASPYRGLLTSAVGQRDVLESGVRWESLTDGDLVLLATDGLTRYYDGEALAGSIAEDLAAGVEVEPLAERLIARANAAGGVDNTSVGVVRVGRLPKRALPVPTLTTQTQVPPRAWNVPRMDIGLGTTSGRPVTAPRRTVRIVALAVTSVCCLAVGVAGSVMYATGGSVNSRPMSYVATASAARSPSSGAQSANASAAERSTSQASDEASSERAGTQQNAARAATQPPKNERAPGSPKPVGTATASVRPLRDAIPSEATASPSSVPPKSTSSEVRPPASSGTQPDSSPSSVPNTVARMNDTGVVRTDTAGTKTPVTVTAASTAAKRPGVLTRGWNFVIRKITGGKADSPPVDTAVPKPSGKRESPKTKAPPKTPPDTTDAVSW